MNAKQALKAGIDGGSFVCDAYLADLTDADLLARPAPGCNHIAWQLGHCIAAEHQMIDAVSPGSMPQLPEGFQERHTKETAHSDNPTDFFNKNVYLKVLKEQRAGTFALLDKLAEADLDKPGPEAMRSYCPTVSAVFTMQGTHWLMHAGQWAVIRRKLGKPPLF
ncbi:MAG: DinB family protein [Pirellulales bacterium]